MPYSITTKDGITINNIPDDISPDAPELKARVASLRSGQGPQQSPILPPKEKGFIEGAVDAASGPALGLVRGAADMGNTLVNAATFIPRQMSPELDQWNRERQESLNDWTKANEDRPGFTTGRIAANIAGTAGVGGVLGGAANAVSNAPRAVQFAEALRTGGLAAKGAGLGTRTAGGAITGAATAGLINPEDAGEGAIIGALMPSAVRGAGVVGRSMGNIVSPEHKELAKTAMERYGIPLGVADVTDNKIVRALRSVLNDAPLTGSIGATQQEAKQRAFNRAVGSTFGAEADVLTPEVMRSAKSAISQNLNNIWGKNVLQVDEPFIAELADIANQARTKLNPEQAATVERHIQNLMSQAQQGKISGEFANNWQSELRQVVEGETGLQKSILNKLRRTTLDAFKRNIPTEEAELLGKATGQYKAYKTVEPLLNKAEAGVAGRTSGDVPAALLPQQVVSSYGDNIASSPFADISQIGSQFLVDRVPQTGGSARALIQNSAIGAALGVGGMSNPLLAAGVIPTGMLLNKGLGSAGLAKRLLNADPKLLNSPQARELLIQALRTAPPAATAQ